MKKGVILIGALFVTLLLISTVTAVPTSHSQPVMKKINQIEQQEKQLETFGDTIPQGIFDLIWQILLALFNLIVKIIEVVNTILTIVQLIQALLNGLQTLIQLIQDFIELINELLNPESVTV